ncbi:hypothetical protein RUND412_001791 [Rhizina undulata]
MKQIIGGAGEYLEEFVPRLAIFAKEEAKVEIAPAGRGRELKTPIKLLEVEDERLERRGNW